LKGKIEKNFCVYRLNQKHKQLLSQVAFVMLHTLQLQMYGCVVGNDENCKQFPSLLMLTTLSYGNERQPVLPSAHHLADSIPETIAENKAVKS
jgi:hypothetical protein